MDHCPVCGEKSVTEDTENGQTVRVCIECGAMDDDMQELTSANQFEGTTVSDGKGYGPKGSKNWMKLESSVAETNKTVGKKLITNIGNQLRVGDHVIMEACQLYERVYEPELHNTSTDSKKAMCLACLYSSARIAQISINIRECSCFLHIKNFARRFGTALKTLKYKYDVHLPPLDYQDETNRVLSRSDLDKDVRKTASQIMLIMQRAMITGGRCCISYAVPCAYIAFKASDIIKYSKLSFRRFCDMFKFRMTYKYGCRSEIEKTLKAMARELPWLKGSNVNIDRVEVYVKDIIKYQSSLFAEAVLSAVNEMEETDKNLTEVNEETVRDSVSVFRQFKKRKHVQGTMDENSVVKKQKPMQEKKADISYDRQNSGNSSDLESFDLGSDDDTDQYILTAKEVKERQKMNIQFGIILDNENNVDNTEFDDKKKQKKQSVGSVKEISKDSVSFNGKIRNAYDYNDESDDGDYDEENKEEGESDFNHLLIRSTDNTEDDKELGNASEDEYYD